MADKEENLAELYSHKLRNTDNPGPVLARFLGLVLDMETNRSHIIAMNKLLKIFGKYTVFLAILDSVNHIDNKERYYGYLYAICKKRFEDSNRGSLVQPYRNLTRTITKIDKKIELAKKRKLRPLDYSILKDKESEANE